MESETIEDRRRKNVIENQNFLRTLQLLNVRDEFKSTVHSVAKPLQKKRKHKANIDPSELRRSSRIQSMPKPVQLPVFDEDLVLPSDEASSDDEDEEDLTNAFTAKIDEDWQPLHIEKVPRVKKPRPIRKATIVANDKMTKKNIEEIRQKNVEENERFLKKLGLKNVRKDFIESTRSILPEKKPAIQYEKVERVTRYSLKVQSGEIKPYVPKWQEKKGKQSSKWTLLFKDNPNPYKRVFKPRVRN